MAYIYLIPDSASTLRCILRSALVWTYTHIKGIYDMNEIPVTSQHTYRDVSHIPDQDMIVLLKQSSVHTRMFICLCACICAHVHVHCPTRHYGNWMHAAEEADMGLEKQLQTHHFCGRDGKSNNYPFGLCTIDRKIMSLSKLFNRTRSECIELPCPCCVGTQYIDVTLLWLISLWTKWPPILQTIFSIAFASMKIYEF